MKQMSLETTGFERKTKRTRKREFLDEMNRVVPWSELVALIKPHAPTRSAKGGRQPFFVETMLRIHLTLSVRYRGFFRMTPEISTRQHSDFLP